MKKILTIIILFFLISCSKESELDKSLDENFFNLELKKSYSYGASFNLSSPQVEYLKIVWSDADNVKIGEKNIDTQREIVTVDNLEPNKSYSFILYAVQGNKNLSSNTVSATTSKNNNTTFDRELVSNNLGSLYIDIVKKVSDGFIIGATLLPTPYIDDSLIEIIKLDNNLNLLWHFNINQSPYADDLAEIHDLENGDFIALAKEFRYTNRGGYYHQIYGLKFNSSGSTKWIKYYNYGDNPDINWYNSPMDYETKPGQLKVLAQVDTTYYQQSDRFNREFEIDIEGNIISESTFEYNREVQTQHFLYDNYGNKFNYGGVDITPNDILVTYEGLLEKYDNNNNLIWSKSYEQFGGDEYINKVAVNDKKIVCIGQSNQAVKWIMQNNLDGTLQWDFQSSRASFLCQGKDIILDGQSNETVTLFHDIYRTEPLQSNTSVIKIDNDGNVVWEFRDEKENNEDNFSPENIFKVNEEYIIIGTKNGSIWGKKFKME